MRASRRRFAIEARLAAELIARSRPSDVPEVAELDDEADRLGQLTAARVTFIAADGRVVGDSSEPLAALATMENHAQRPEVIDAREKGIGRAQRYSATLQIDMLYIAVPVAHPAIAYVRMALPLTDVRQQLRPILTATLVALGFALVGAGAIAWMFSARIGRRVRLIAQLAERYQQGDLTPPRLGFGDDELGTVARALDDSVQEVGRRLAEQARDRARMEAMLAGMVEGVIVVDSQGRLQLVNDAAQQMLRLESRRRSDGRTSKRFGCRRSRSWSRPSCSVARPDAGAAVAAAGSIAHHHGDGRAGGRHRGARRGAGAARHHRAAARRSDPPRLRRQRVARAADAADGDPRLRRSAVRGRHQLRGSSGGSSRSSDATRSGWSAWSRICCGWRGSTPGRRRSDVIAVRYAQPHRHGRLGCGAGGRGTQPARRGDHRPGRRHHPRRSGEAARCAAQPGRQRDHLLAGALEDRHRRDVGPTAA